MRAIWKGALSFGLVNIPVRLYTASREKELSFVLLHKKDNSEIRYARYCKAEEKEVSWNEIVKGYPLDNGQYVILQDSDFEKVNRKKTETIEIVNFTEEEEIESIYYVKPYFLEPEKAAMNAYGLLRDALKKSKKVGIAKYVLKNKEHIAIIKPHKNMIVLNEIRYPNELIVPADLKLPEMTKLPPKEMEMALQLIDHLTVPFDPKKYKDTYTDEIKAMIKQKSKGKPVSAKKEKPKSSKVYDMMELLQESLRKTKKMRKTG